MAMVWILYFFSFFLNVLIKYKIIIDFFFMWTENLDIFYSFCFIRILHSCQLNIYFDANENTVKPSANLSWYYRHLWVQTNWSLYWGCLIVNLKYSRRPNTENLSEICGFHSHVVLKLRLLLTEVSLLVP